MKLVVLGTGLLGNDPVSEHLEKQAEHLDLRGDGESSVAGRLFGVDRKSLARGAAALQYLGETGSPPSKPCIALHPIHLHPRRDELILMAGRDFEPDAEEARSLIEDLQQYYPEWAVETTNAYIWFALTGEEPDVATTPLDETIGRDIANALPVGPGAMDWQRIMNEVQMIMASADVNQIREQHDRPAINGVWAETGSDLPDLQGTLWERVCGDHPLVQGLGRLTGAECEFTDNTGPMDKPYFGSRLFAFRAATCERIRSQIIAEEQLGHFDRWLRDGTLTELVLLDPGNRGLRLRPSTLKRRLLSWFTLRR